MEKSNLMNDAFLRKKKEIILDEIHVEMIKQDEKWGTQSHPSVDQVLLNREGSCTPERMCEEYEIPSENRAKQMCDIHAKRGDLTWAHITIEELSEAVSAKDDTERRKELIQLAAVVTQWINDIDNKS